MEKIKLVRRFDGIIEKVKQLDEKDYNTLQRIINILEKEKEKIKQQKEKKIQ